MCDKIFTIITGAGLVAIDIGASLVGQSIVLNLVHAQRQVLGASSCKSNQNVSTQILILAKLNFFTLVAIILKVRAGGVSSVDEGPLGGEESAGSVGQRAMVQVEQLAVVRALVAAVKGRTAQELALDFASALAGGLGGCLQLLVHVEVERHVLRDFVVGHADAWHLEALLRLAGISTCAQYMNGHFRLILFYFSCILVCVEIRVFMN